MKIEKTSLEGVLIITPDVFEDNRGHFVETYHSKKYELPLFVQDNESLSRQGVLRGLHYQIPPYAQGKLIRVISGRILDVIIDIKYHSPTFSKHICTELSSDDKKQIYIPSGFAHGFIVLSQEAIFTYKCTAFYNPEHERGIIWNDSHLKLDWQIKNPIVGKKDLKNRQLAELIPELMKIKDWNKNV